MPVNGCQERSVQICSDVAQILALLQVSSNLNAEAEPKQRRSCRFQTRSS